MPKFTYDDIVRVREDMDSSLRPGETGWVVAVFPDRTKATFDWLPEGVIYTIEFEDGEVVDVNEDAVEAAERPS